MTLNDSLVYWDSCVFIDRLEAKNPSRIDILRAMTDAVEIGDLEIVTSAFSLTEVVKLSKLTELDDEKKEQLILAFFENEYIHIRNVDPKVSELTRMIIRDHNLKPPDAVHVATAILNHVDVLQTYDDNHLTPKNGLIHYKDIWDKPLRIEHPKWVWQPKLENGAVAVPPDTSTEVVAKADAITGENKETPVIPSLRRKVNLSGTPDTAPTEADSE